MPSFVVEELCSPSWGLGLGAYLMAAVEQWWWSGQLFLHLQAGVWGFVAARLWRIEQRTTRVASRSLRSIVLHGFSIWGRKRGVITPLPPFFPLTLCGIVGHAISSMISGSERGATVHTHPSLGSFRWEREKGSLPASLIGEALLLEAQAAFCPPSLYSPPCIDL